MSRHLDYRDLEPVELRIALMRAAQLSEAAIASFIGVDYTTVAAILKRPRVARHLLALQSTMARDLAAATEDLSKSIDDWSHRAFAIETDVMERLYATPEEQRGYIRAMLGAAATAQDILDRAGKRAPTKVDHTHHVDLDAVSRIADVLREDTLIDVRIAQARLVAQDGDQEEA